MARFSAIATMHRREMNRTEAEYAEHLRERLLVNEIRWWAFEAWKFRLADKTYYTPDFIVVLNDLRIEAHEVKALWGTGKPGWHEDARVKIKVAAEQHPVHFVAVTKTRDGWEFEHFGQGLGRDLSAPDFRHLTDVNEKFLSMHFDTEADAQRAMELVKFACGLER